VPGAGLNPVPSTPGDSWPPGTCLKRAASSFALTLMAFTAPGEAVTTLGG
jgi:hypothetical protein